MSATLKDGSQPKDPRLDRIYEEDWRSMNFRVGSVQPRPTAAPLKKNKPRSYTWRCNLWMDQGVEGACVSTGCGHELAAAPLEVKDVTFEWCRDNIYHTAQHDDPWPGCSLGPECPIEPQPEAYDGTAVLSGVKQLVRLGFAKKYTWALTLEEAVLGIGYQGPAICGFRWYTGMYDADENGYIHPTGEETGGHCLLAHAVKIVRKKSPKSWLRRSFADVDLDKSYITFHNSWGFDWGVAGRARITLRDFDKLLQAQGEVCFIERTAKRVI